MPHPDKAYWLEVHIRFTRGNFAAWEEVAAYFLPSLSQRLSYRRHDVDEDLIAESVEDALMDYQKNPQRFDATRGVFLGCWLFTQARGRLSNLLRRERRHQAKERSAGVTDKILEKLLSEMADERTMYIGRDEGEFEERKLLLNKLLWKLSLHECAKTELLSREAAFEEWVEYLGIAHLPTAEQHSKVNAEKGSVMKKLRRLGKHLWLAVPAWRAR